MPSSKILKIEASRIFFFFLLSRHWRDTGKKQKNAKEGLLLESVTGLVNIATCA